MPAAEKIVQTVIRKNLSPECRNMAMPRAISAAKQIRKAAPFLPPRPRPYSRMLSIIRIPAAYAMKIQFEEVSTLVSSAVQAYPGKSPAKIMRAIPERENSSLTLAVPSLCRIVISQTPSPLKTVPTVLAIIFQSVSTLCSSIYLRSSSIQSSKGISFLSALICQKQVRPGVTESLLR